MHSCRFVGTSIAEAAFYCMGGGIVGALLAALPGFIDLVSLPAGPRSTAIKHMVINLTVVGLYAINFWMRLKPPHAARKLVWLSLIAVGLLIISAGWLGRKMVFEHGIAVDTPPDATRR